MVNVNKLRGKIVECELTIEKLADKINIDKTTIYRKLNGNGKNFTIEEADLIAEALNLDCAEVQAIFFSQYVT